ncbi:uncharacterized protein [Musca autumnalis]|uniref:uncharacterized protein n=1 Tax=Musca autumnalis TaxID=221902 RepID=UPI003CED2C31
MNRLTNEQRLQIIEFYYQNQCSVRNVFRALRPIYGLHNRPSEQTINAIVTKFRTQFTLLDIKPTTRMRTVRTEENIASVSESVAEDREMSIRRGSQQLGLCYSTTWKILRKDLGVKPYKIQLVQELKPNDLPQRRIFSEWALEKLAENPLFYRQILFSDEAHFWLNGYVNKQNCRIWSEEQVKSKVYRNKPATIPALEDNISEEIRAIPAEMLEKVAQNWTFRMDHLRRSRGQHLNEIIFKK